MSRGCNTNARGSQHRNPPTAKVHDVPVYAATSLLNAWPRGPLEKVPGNLSLLEDYVIEHNQASYDPDVDCPGTIDASSTTQAAATTSCE